MNPAASLEALSRRLPSRRAFVTGAASGLGRAIALALARDGWRIGLLDVSAERTLAAEVELRSAGARTHTYVGDVAAEVFVDASIADFVAQAGGLDLMVNNAGVAVAGAMEDTPVDDWRWIVDINLLGVVWGCRAALPVMRAQGSGIVLNVGSSAGFAAAPGMSAYNATKAAVIAISETLAGELNGSGVQVSVAMPGFFRTRLLETMRAPPVESELAHRLLHGSRHDADAAAGAVLRAVSRGALYIVWPQEYWLLWHLKRLFPMWFLRRAGKLRARLASAPPPPG
jgi:NAD(P)-dependent dehydrogenase (short-subunit alcohol dehydrogenase family)